MSDCRWRDRVEDVVEVFGLLLVDLAEELLAQHLREAADRVQRGPQLVRHVGQELRLVAARGLELAALLVQLRQRTGQLAGSLLDLLLEPGIGRLQPGSHPVELVGQGAELVAAGDVDPLIERPGADLRRRDLDRLDGPGEIPCEQHARRDCHQEEHDQEPDRAPDRRLDGRERHAQGLLDEHPPSGRVDALERAQHLRPLGITSVGDHATGPRGAGQCGVHLRQRPEVGVGEDETDVRGVGDDLAAGIDGVGVARGADLRPADRVDDGPEVDVRDDDALARAKPPPPR